MAYGPFVHGLNKGGLAEIVRTSRLISTEGRHGGHEIRARVGDFKSLQTKLRWAEGGTYQDRIFIQFDTDIAPRTGEAPGSASWPMPAGNYLHIRIVGIFTGSGRQIPFLEALLHTD